MKKQLSIIDKLKFLILNKKFWIAITILAAGFTTTYIASYYLSVKYGSTLPILKDDLILNFLPSANVAWLYDILSFISIIILAIYVLRKDFEEIPFIISLFGIYHFVRGIFIILTPLGVPNGGDQGIVTGLVALFGQYPSGHLGSVFLTFLIMKGIYKQIAIFLTFAIGITLLVGRGHYSIDLFSSIFFVYAIYSFGNKYFRKKMKIK